MFRICRVKDLLRNISRVCLGVRRGGAHPDYSACHGKVDRLCPRVQFVDDIDDEQQRLALKPPSIIYTARGDSLYGEGG